LQVDGDGKPERQVDGRACGTDWPMASREIRRGRDGHFTTPLDPPLLPDDRLTSTIQGYTLF